MKTYFIGRLTQNAEVKPTKDGNGSFLTMRVAVNVYENGAQKAYFIDVTQFNYRANMVPHLTKGSLVQVTGSLQISAYVTREGAALPDIRLTADSVEFPGFNSGSGNTQANTTTVVTQTVTTPKAQQVPVEEEIVMTTPKKQSKGGNTQQFTATPEAGSDDLPF